MRAFRPLMAAALVLSACGSSDAPTDNQADKSAEAPAEKPAEKAEFTGPAPALLVVQAQFGQGAKPLPAKLSIMRRDEAGKFHREDIEDPEANVFHKAMAFDGGILTIGAEKAPKPATLKLWKKGADGWTAETLWSRAWEGAKFNRFRDIEIGDVTGDGQDNLVIATHDRGVTAVGTKGADGTWTFAEFDEKPDTFVHEIEIGDVDGDGVNEFYATPSDRNRASGESQPGGVVRYDHVGDGQFKQSQVVYWENSHAKEILVADVDGDGTDELYIAREGHKEKGEDGQVRLVDPVAIVQMIPGSGGWTEKVVATIQDDQNRFLLADDVDHDGQLELIAAGFKSGLWMLERGEDGMFEPVLIDANSGGFEHAAHTADLDGDGKVEIYVAADQQKEFRMYTWNGSDGFDRKIIGSIGPSDRSHITWNIQDGTF